MGPRFVGDEFETPVYRVDGGCTTKRRSHTGGIAIETSLSPGQDIEHVVDDNEKSTRDRVDLP